MREPLVQHEIHDHAGDGYVHPQWPGPAGDGAMLRISGLESATQSDNRKRHDDDGQRDMRSENRKIDGSRPSLAEKTDVADLEVEEEIASQKQRRRHYGGDHAGAMGSHATARNQDA